MSEKPTAKPSKTDWAKVDALREEDFDCTDNPPLDDAFWAKAVLVPGTKQQITLRLDGDVLDYFKSRGRGYQTAINAVLRRYVEMQKSSSRVPVVMALARQLAAERAAAGVSGVSADDLLAAWAQDRYGSDAKPSDDP